MDFIQKKIVTQLKSTFMVFITQRKITQFRNKFYHNILYIVNMRKHVVGLKSIYVIQSDLFKIYKK